MITFLGVTRRKFSFDNNDFSDSYVIRRKMNSMGKNIMLNKNSPNLLNRLSDLQSLFMDPTCRGCYTCMERAMKAQKPHIHMMDPRISSENFQDDRNMIEASRRDKRKAKSENTSAKTKRSKSKRNKGVTLTKYNDNGRIYALKIKETNLAQELYNKTVTTCKVFTVQKSFSCDSPEANLILIDSKKRANKKGRKGHRKRETKVIKHTTVNTPVYGKRNIDDSHVQEQIMPSIEEMY